MNFKIISGGQTGADLAGLRVAKLLGLPTGGVAPFGFFTQNGNQPDLKTVFGLTDHGNYRQRTIQNVRTSDVTLIFSKNMSPGTILTKNSAMKLGKPLFMIMDNRHEGESLRQYWSDKNDPRHEQFNNAAEFLIKTLKFQLTVVSDDFFIINVAGNATKELKNPSAFDFAFVSMWYMLMILGRSYQHLSGNKNPFEFAELMDPIDLAEKYRDVFGEI